MFKRLFCLLPFFASTLLSATPAVRLVDPALLARLGYDSNPIASGGPTAAVLGNHDTLTTAAGASLGLAFAPGPALSSGLTLTYAGEWQHFADWTGEDFSMHRFGLSTGTTAGAWKITLEDSSLFVAGNRDPLASVATVNAHAISLWRERRRQWQHRLKTQARGDFGALMVRGTASLLDHDFETRARSGFVGNADRSDLQAALDLGWKQSSSSLWIAGVRAGEQRQGIVPLPNCEFEYSNRYHRLAFGWEGKPSADTTLSLTAGPDFRHYTGAIDPRVFLGGRDRTSLWFEGAFNAKVTPALSLTGKLARTDWLASTGKSAYLDASADLAAVYTWSPQWSGRLSARAHRATYFPVVRDDWESLFGAGASWTFSSHATLSLDLLRHRGWNGLGGLAGREFHRLVAQFGCGLKF